MQASQLDAYLLERAADGQDSSQFGERERHGNDSASTRDHMTIMRKESDSPGVRLVLDVSRGEPVESFCLTAMLMGIYM
jgi:hypothetical protein